MLDAVAPYAYNVLWEMHMRTTVDLNEELLRQAREHAPELTKTALIEEGLRALVKLRAARRLADAIGTQPSLTAPPRRRKTS